MHADLKKIAVDYLGGGCLFCGPVECLASLDFHHINPPLKVQNISSYSSASEEFFAELDKCACLCKNCHAKVHHDPRFSHDLFEILET
jgi:hypothetical protein